MSLLIHAKSRAARQRGMTLVEVLVALVVLSIGMLGIAALYLETLRANRTAMMRTQAVALVNDMADRIRANPRGRLDYDISEYGGAPVKRNCVVTSNCSAAALAEDDLAWWMERINAALPSASERTVTVTPLSGGLDRYRIRVSWPEPGETGPLVSESVFELLRVIP